MAKVAFVSIMWHSRFVEELGVDNSCIEEGNKS